MRAQHKEDRVVGDRPQSSGVNHFSQAALNAIFQVSPNHPDRLNSRESTKLEFKKSFNWGSGSEYGRTCAAFANREGGYIVFGVDTKPHRIVGLQGKAFAEIDPERVSATLNEYFAPEIRWDMHVHEIKGFSFGILFIYESSEKPVICCKAGSEVKEGQIYYRYNGRTQSIRYPELRQLIEERRRREQLLWMHHMRRIARIGVRDTGIFDLKTGVTAGAHGSFIIDEALLPQLQFIREGQFDEKRGAPAVRVMGKAEIVGKGIIGSVRRVARTQAIRTPDIIQAFLDARPVTEPVEYLSQICFESSAFLPFYFLLKQAGMTIPKAIELLHGIKSTQSAKNKLIERLSSSDDLSRRIPSEGNSRGAAKCELRNAMREGRVKLGRDHKITAQQLGIIRTLGMEDIRSPFVLEFVRNAYSETYGKNPDLSSAIRYAVSHIDRILNRVSLESV